MEADDKYAVVKFEGGAVSVVPSNWIADDTTCFWPKQSKNLRTQIIKKATPQVDWESHIIVDIFGHYAFYRDALEAEKSFGRTTDEDSDGNVRPGKRRIKKKRIPDVYTIPCLNDNDIDGISDGSSTSSFISDNSKVLSEKMKEISFTQKNITIKENETEESVSSEPSSEHLTESIKENVDTSSKLKSNEKSIGQKKSIDRAENMTLDTTVSVEDVTVQNTSMLLQNFVGIPEGQLKVLTDLILETHAMVKVISHKLNVKQDSSETTSSILKDDKIRNIFPMNDMECLMNTETNLKSDDEMVKQLFYRLTLIGGTDYKNLIRRSLQFLMTDDLGVLCSWTGQKENFRVKDLKVMQILMDAVKATYPRITDKDFSTTVGDWLRFAKQRKQRKSVI